MSLVFENLLWLTWAWPMLMALSLAWSPMRTLAIRMLPLALVPGLLLWLAYVVGVFPPDLSVAWPNVLLGTTLGLNDLSLIWLSLSLAVWTAAAWHSVWIKDHQAWWFALFFLLSLSGSLGLVLAQDAISFYLSFSLMSLAAWGLVVHERTTQAKRAANWYLVLALLGELVLFVGLVARAAELQTLDLSLWAEAPLSWPLVWIWLGLAVKVGVPVLHVWLPLAHPAAPVPASAVLSGVMIKAGFIGWWILMPSVAMQDAAWLSALGWLGVVTMLFGVVIGLMQTEAKAVLAYSSISQMGWLIWGLSWVWASAQPQTLFLWLALFALHHALVKGALFLGVGWVKYSAPNAAWMPWVWAALILLALMLAGLPMSSGAWLKNEMKLAAESGAPGWALWAASVGTGLLMIQFLRRLARVEIDLKPLAKRALFSWFALIAVALIWPWFVAEPVALAADWLKTLQPLVLAAILALAWRIRVHKQWSCPPGDMLLIFEWAGSRLGAFIHRHQAWWLKQGRHLRWTELKARQLQRRGLKHLTGLEAKWRAWPNFVMLVVGLVVVQVVVWFIHPG